MFVCYPSDMTTEVRTPFSVSAVELSNGGLFRKQILKFGTINYTDRKGNTRKITFDTAYGRNLIKAFKKRAYAQVPFQLADADNRHTNDPTRTGGEVVGVDLSADGSGVDGILRTWGEGTRVVEQNPKLGVSSRMFENITMSDGRTFPVALQHVLGTVDPQQKDQHPWEKIDSVELSAGSIAESVDLSTATYERSATMPETEGGGDTVTLTLSPEKAARLNQLLEDDEGLEGLADQLSALGIDLDDTDEDDEDPEEETSETELSSPNTEAIELANAQIASQEQRLVELTGQLRRQRVNTEVDTFQREGLSPAVLDLARPLLAVETGAVELANGVPGEAVDPGEVIREVLTSVIELARSGHLLVDTDGETGDLRGVDAVSGQRAALLKDWENYG
jgi:hypothetical protein